MGWNVHIPPAEWYSPTPPAPTAQYPYSGAWRFDIEPVIREALDQVVISLDTETTGLNIVKDMPIFWSLAWGERRMCMPISTLHMFKEVFERPDIRWVFANAKFDVHMLAQAGVFLKGELCDTQVMHALLYEEHPHGLKEMAKQLLHWKWTDFKNTFGLSERRKGAVADALYKAELYNLPLLVEYASNDAYGTLKIYEVLKKELEDTITFSLYPEEFKTMADIFFKIEMPFTRTLWKMERKGISIDTDYLNRISGPAGKAIEDLEKEITKVAGRIINPNSPDQMVNIFINEMGLKPVRMTKGGKSGVRKPSVDYDFLDHYKNEVPLAKLMLEHRDLTKLKNTYVDGLQSKLDANNRIHPRFQQSTARTGRLSSADPNCFHPDTELLTRNGWKKISILEKGEEVAQWGTDSAISFVLPTSYIKQHADELVYIKNQHIRLKVTKDHRCLLRHRRTGKLKVFNAERYPEDWLQIHSGVYTGGNLSINPDFLRLLIATQADGSISPSRALAFGFKKQRKIRRLVAVLNRLGKKYTRYKKNKNGATVIRLTREAAADVVSILGVEKLFGPWLLEMTKENIDTFCKEIYFWDGSWTRKNNYSSNIEVNSRWVQTVLALSGKRAHFRHYLTSNGKISYQVDVMDKDSSFTTNVKRSIQKYDGDVYCVSVPSSYVLTRLEGEICVTGQCQNIPKSETDRFQIRAAFIPRPGYDLTVIDYMALEMRLLAAAAMDPLMSQIFLDGKDIHMGNAEMVFGRKLVPPMLYDEIKAAKKTDGLVKEGKLQKEAMTDRYKLAIKFRSNIKSVSFGLNYGMKESKLARDLGISKTEALALMEEYMATYPAVQRFYAESIAETEQTGFSYTIIGRRRFHPEIHSLNKMDRFKAQRQATNNQIQGSAADVVRFAQLLIDHSGIEEAYGCDMLLQVHDELVFECPKEHTEKVKPILKDLMEHPFYTDLSVPLEVSMAHGANWMAAK